MYFFPSEFPPLYLTWTFAYFSMHFLYGTISGNKLNEFRSHFIASNYNYDFFLYLFLSFLSSIFFLSFYLSTFALIELPHPSFVYPSICRIEKNKLFAFYTLSLRSGSIYIYFFSLFDSFDFIGFSSKRFHSFYSAIFM